MKVRRNKPALSTRGRGRRGAASARSRRIHERGLGCRVLLLRDFCAAGQSANASCGGECPVLGTGLAAGIRERWWGAAPYLHRPRMGSGPMNSADASLPLMIPAAQNTFALLSRSSSGAAFIMLPWSTASQDSSASVAIRYVIRDGSGACFDVPRASSFTSHCSCVARRRADELLNVVPPAWTGPLGVLDLEFDQPSFLPANEHAEVGLHDCVEPDDALHVDPSSRVVTNNASEVVIEARLEVVLGRDQATLYVGSDLMPPSTFQHG